MIPSLDLANLSLLDDGQHFQQPLPGLLFLVLWGPGNLDVFLFSFPGTNDAALRIPAFFPLCFDDRRLWNTIC
jgi:hypothetical protein